MRTVLFVSITSLLAVGCGPGSEAKKIEKMVAMYVDAVDRGDEDLAMQCLLDHEGFLILNEDLGTRTNEASEDMLGALMSNYSHMVSKFDGRDVTLKKFTLGQFWDQYKGHAGFYRSRAVLDVDGEEQDFVIKAMVSIADKWYIIDLDDNSY